MKKLLIIAAVVLSQNSYGQNGAILADRGKTLENIIPTNWKLLDSTLGDLNQDNITDLVFAIQKTDPNNIKLNDGLGTNSIDLNPRILAIYFGDKSRGFNKKLISNHFIILRDSPTMDEPLEGFNTNKKKF